MNKFMKYVLLLMVVLFALSLPVQAEDNTVYTTSMGLQVGPMVTYGLYKINGEYCIPLQRFMDQPFSNGWNGWISYTDYNGEIEITIDPEAVRYTEYDANLNYGWVPPEGVAAGVAQAEPVSISCKGLNEEDFIYTLDGWYPMVKLSTVKKVCDDVTIDESARRIKLFQSNPELFQAVGREDDLVGASLWSFAFKGNTQEQNLRGAHDYIVRTMEYDPAVGGYWSMTEEEYAAIENLYEEAYNKYKNGNNQALYRKIGICETYASLVNEYCMRLGIPCMKVSGTAGGPHSWNRVYIDGRWQYLDATWDDPVDRYKDPDSVKYTYYLVSADEIYCTHYWQDKDYVMPEYDVSWQNLDSNNITSEDMYRKCFVAQLAAGKKTVELRVTKGGFYGGYAFISYYADQGLFGFFVMSGGYDSAAGKYIFYFDREQDYMLGW